MPPIERYGPLVSGDDLQFQAAPTEGPGARDNVAEKGGANAMAAPLRQHVKFFEPPNHAAVLGTEMGGRVGDADEFPIHSREQDEAVPRIGNYRPRHLAQSFR